RTAYSPARAEQTQRRGPSGPCPLYPRKQTCAAHKLMSALGQWRTHAAQQKGSLFDHVIDDGENAGRNGEAECLCGREIYNELEFSRLYHRQVSGLGALKDATASGRGTIRPDA